MRGGHHLAADPLSRRSVSNSSHRKKRPLIRFRRCSGFPSAYAGWREKAVEAKKGKRGRASPAQTPRAEGSVWKGNTGSRGLNQDKQAESKCKNRQRRACKHKFSSAGLGKEARGLVFKVARANLFRDNRQFRTEEQLRKRNGFESREKESEHESRWQSDSETTGAVKKKKKSVISNLVKKIVLCLGFNSRKTPWREK